ncbi:MAG: tetratricopeptide repeat protein [Bacteroidales bacterium]
MKFRVDLLAQLCNRKPTLRLLTLSLAMISTISLFSQKIELIFSKGFGKPKTIQVEFCDSLGSNTPTANAFLQSGKLFFTVKPSEEQTWTLSTKDVDVKIKELKLIQGDKIVSTLQSTAIMNGVDVGGAIISFAKMDVDITKPFKIRIKELNSDDIVIPEKLWPNFAIYSALIRKSQTAYAAHDYAQSFFNLRNLWSKENISTYLSAFSFYKSASDSINQYAILAANSFSRNITEHYNALQVDCSELEINTIHALGNKYLNDLRGIDSFFVAHSTEFDAKSKSELLTSISQSISVDLKKADDYYVKKNLSIFETSNYQDYRFTVYSDLLAKLMTSIEKISVINGFDSIPLAQIKSYKSIYKEIADMSWDRNFKIVVQLLNANIKKNKTLFSEAALANFANLKSTEPQPYSLLFKGFNSLIKKDKNAFADYVSQSMATITDKELLLNLDLLTSLMNGNTTKNEEFWGFIQKGFESQSNGTLQEAKGYYEKAEKLSNTNEVLYLLMAQTNLKLGDRYGAEIYFKRANTINPKFILSKLYQIDFLTEDKDYETALNFTNEALTTSPYWYFYYMKAQLLQLTGKNEDAKVILLNNCIAINPLNYEEYLLLGDVYSNLNDLKNARENYMKAGNIKPNDIIYKKKMEALKFFQVKAVK